MTEFEDWIASKERRRSRKNGFKRKSRVTPQKAPKKSRRRAPGGFDAEIRAQAIERAKSRCENPICQRFLPDPGGEHHCLPRSFYRKSDRNNLWNCAHICPDCHYRITFPKSDSDIRLRRYFERIAIARRTYSDNRLERELGLLEEALRSNTLDLIRHFQSFT